ncbi:PUB domain-containing protein [Cynara cardunculus var. scolymus]|uniref:PUB domain-containing protein n=1 Tax=Cynara cardunculus var. scolymus TaxID=59895 RepID=A0A124SEJ8_CYNCS|nr:PUB domain-containing protein [Cynara cardunculus var. scolymus]
MAGVSLKCGDCGALLKSVEEAQEHAELTSHTNFSESTEAVLNLVCSTCGKPCRSKTESDLHTKRTGHTEFSDKTSETAKPITLEVPKKQSNDDVDMADASTTGEPEGIKYLLVLPVWFLIVPKMVVPDVDLKLLEELESMGFSKARATRALHFSGERAEAYDLKFLSRNSDLEAAANWIVEHEDDADIDQMPMVLFFCTSLTCVSAKSKSEPPKPSLTPEEKKAKAQELKYNFFDLLDLSVDTVERARKKKEEEERRMEREREKERIRIGKELLEAKRIEEDNERKRIIALRKAEKEEERRAREKIRQKLEEDKAERRRKLGLPAEDPSAPKPSAPVVEEKKSSLPIRPATKAEQMRECLRSLKQSNKDDEAKVKTAFNTLLTYVKNAATKPEEEKFRKIRLSNAAFQDRVGKLEGGIKFLELCGFEKVEGDEFLFLARDKIDRAVLNSAGSELNSAINNPFFGVL